MLENAVIHSDFFYFCLTFIFLLAFFHCQSLKRLLADRTAWDFLSLFSLSQATFYCFHLVQQFGNVFPFLATADPLFSALSLTMIGAFAVNIRDFLGELPKNRKWLFVLLIAGFAGFFLGRRPFAFTQAVFIGLPAIWFTVKVFANGTVFKTRSSCICHRVTCISLILYAVLILASGGRLINSNSCFFEIINIIVAALFMSSLWFCSRAPSMEEASPAIEKGQKALRFFLPISMILIMPLGYLLAIILGDSALENEKMMKRNLGNSLEFLLEGHFEQADILSESMSVSPALANALINPATEAIQLANEVMDQFAFSYLNSVAYLMNKDGLTIASSNRESDKSFAGRNFAFRPYFKEAMEGRHSIYFAKGSVSKEYGYYSAYPIKSLDNQVVGVCAFKVTMEKIAAHFPENPPTILLDENDDEIISNRPAAFWNDLFPLNNEKMLSMPDISHSDLTMKMSFRQIGHDELVADEKKNLILWRYSLVGPGWSFYLLEGSDTTLWARLLSLSITLLACLISLGVSAIWAMSLTTAQKVEKDAKVYQTLVEGSSNIIALIDIYGNFLTLNEAGRKEFGFSDDSYNIRLPELWHGDSANLIRAAIQDSLNGKKTFCEASRIDEDGKVSYWEIWFNPILAEKSRPSQIIGIFHNFTTRKIATKELSREKDLTGNLLNTAQAIILFLDMSGAVMRVNDYFYDLTGFRPEDVIGKNWLENFIPSRDKTKINAFFYENSTNLGPDPVINQILKADGNTLEIEWKNRTLKGDDGKPAGVISVGQDITQHVEIENTLRESKSKFSMLNNCFIRFGNDPRENINMLTEIVWLLTGSDLAIVREVTAGKFRMLGISSISEELNAEQVECCDSTVCPCMNELEKIGNFPVLISNLRESRFFCEKMSVFSSIIISPVHLGEELTGCLICYYDEPRTRMLEEDLNLVSIVTRAIGVEIARLREDIHLHQVIDELASKDKRMSLEMEIARTVHRSFLPSSAPRFSPYRIGTVFKPCFSVGGDYFEFVPFSAKDQMGILFADISGHGVAGALLSSMLKVIMMSVISDNIEPSGVLSRMNDRIEENFPSGYFVAAFFAQLDKHSDTITFASAAPEPALILKKNGVVERIGKGGQPMGLLPSEFIDEDTFASVSVRIEVGDTLIFFTDGLTDIKISETERIGLDRFCTWLSELAGKGPQELSDEVYRRATEAAIEGGIDDDIMLIAITREESSDIAIKS